MQGYAQMGEPIGYADVIAAEKRLSVRQVCEMAGLPPVDAEGMTCFAPTLLE